MGRRVAVSLLTAPLLAVPLPVGATATTPVEPGDVVSGLEVAVVFPRHLQVDGERVAVAVTNGSDETLLIADADRPVAELDVAIAASRCEPHAVIESKKSFEFPVWVTTGDYEGQRIVIEPTGAARTELQTMIDECLQRHVGA